MAITDKMSLVKKHTKIENYITPPSIQDAICTVCKITQNLVDTIWRTLLKPVSLEKTGCKRSLKFKNRSVKVIVQKNNWLVEVVRFKTTGYYRFNN